MVKPDEPNFYVKHKTRMEVKFLFETKLKDCTVPKACCSKWSKEDDKRFHILTNQLKAPAKTVINRYSGGALSTELKDTLF